MITILNKQQLPIHSDQIRETAKRILSYLGYADFDLGIMLTDNKTIQEYNKKYRHHDTPTDILSFPFHTDIKAGEHIDAKTADEKNLGDLIISPEFVKNDLKQWNQSFDERMQHILVHGICHLLGYTHTTNEEHKIMAAKEKELISHLRSL